MAKTGDTGPRRFCGREIDYGRSPQLKASKKKSWTHRDGRLECAVCPACCYKGAKETDLVGGPYARQSGLV